MTLPAPGHYVFRLMPSGSSLKSESVGFKARSDAENWREYVQGLHPNHVVFIAQVEESK